MKAKLIGIEEAGMITDLMQCHSWYVQQLSHYLEPGKEKATASDVKSASKSICKYASVSERNGDTEHYTNQPLESRGERGEAAYFGTGHE